MGREATTIVQKSGNLYLVGNREEALCVDMDDATQTPIDSTQSLLAHLATNEPWKVITDKANLPTLVTLAIKRFEEHASQ